jgi:hypothetical protein
MHRNMCIFHDPVMGDLYPTIGALYSVQRSEFMDLKLGTFF